MNENVKIEDALARNDYLTVSKYVHEGIDELREIVGRNDLKALEEELQCYKAKLSLTIKREYFQKDLHFLFGRFIGYMEALDERIADEYKKKAFIESINMSDISEVPHVNEIIDALYKSEDEGIRHGRLADKAGIDKSTLSGIMDKLVKKGAVSFTRPGKFKYYYLTDLGKKYYEDNLKMIEAEMDIDALTEQLQIALSKEDDANGRLLHIIADLCGEKNNFKGYKPKRKDKINPARIFVGIPSIKEQILRFVGSNQVYVTDGTGVVLNYKEADISFLNVKNTRDIYQNLNYEVR